MLIVTSNWCVPDGSLSAGPAAGLLERFRAEVRRASLRAGFRADGTYRPPTAVAVVLAGDTFDWLTSREWVGDVRPWEASRRAEAARERAAVRSLRLGGRLIATLASWGRRGLVVPAADRRGRPVPGGGCRVPVGVSVLRGDRDRWVDRMTAGGGGIPGVSAGSRWDDGDVTVRHGEEIEPPWQEGGREPTLGDSLAVELVARFAASSGEVAAGLRPRMAAAVRGIVVGRLVDAPTRLAGWLNGQVRSGTLSAATRAALVDDWNHAVAGWHRAARRLGVARAAGVDVADDVAAALTLRDGAGEAFPAVPWPEPGTTAAGTVPLPGPAACEILGHPPAGYMPPPSWRRRLLCIGPPALPPACQDCGLGAERVPPGLALFDPPGMIPRVAAAAWPAVPAAAVVAAGPAGPWLDWLPLVDGGPPPMGRHRDCGPHGIWRSQPCSSRRLVVDAA